MPHPKLLVALGALMALLTSAADAMAASARALDARESAKLRSAAAKREKVTLRGVALGRAQLDELELEPMDVWAADARILVDGEKTLPLPDTKYFQGRVKGTDDSAVFLAVSKKKTQGLVLLGEKRFNLASAVGEGKKKDDDLSEAPLAVSELDSMDDVGDPAAKWQCEVEQKPLTTASLSSKPSITTTTFDAPIATHDGGSVGAAYKLRIGIETDYELAYFFNGDTAALTAYVANLVGQASVIFQRDVNTTLLVGHVNLRTTSNDPWTTGVESGTAIALREFGNYWHHNYGQVSRSAAVMISGKPFNAGIAWTGTLCGGDGYCGDNGNICGGFTWAGAWAGPYAFLGSSDTVATTVADPTLTVGGVQYALPNDNNYWMLLQLAHELGHVASSPHTQCVALTPAEKSLYGVSRDWVDACASQEGCNNGTTSFPAEYGTIMSYCHQLFTGSGYRASRYVFGKLGEPSAKMLDYLRAGLDNGAPDATIRLGTSTNIYEEESQPIPCAAGRAASVVACTSCTYAWSIAGGTITSATNTNAITYTPNAHTTTLTVSITNANGCATTLSRSVITECSTLTAPQNLVATASSPSLVALTWNAVSGAASYEVSRRAAGSATFITVGSTTSNALNDVTAAANSAYLYRVRALDNTNFPSPESNTDFTTTFAFTDPTLTTSVTRMKAAHVTELRGAVDALRSLASLAAATWTDASLSGAIAVKAAHVSELRTALAQARTALGAATAAFTDASVSSQTVKAIHIEQIRTNVR